jgi:cell division septation protein DedD
MAYEPQERERAADDERRPRAGRRVLTLLMGVAAVAAVAAVGVFAYKEGVRRGAESVAPVITAGAGPDKVKPDDPGGMEVPNRDKQVYDRLLPEAAPKKVERLLPPPETPMALPAATAAAPSVATDAAATASAPPMPAPPEPKTDASRASVPPPPMTASKEPATAPPAPPLPSVPMASATPAPPASHEMASIAPAAGGKYRVQLASLRTAEQAEAAIARARKANGDILASLTFSVARADLGAKGVYYRVQAGPLADAAAAKELCDRLKDRKQGCLVVSP